MNVTYQLPHPNIWLLLRRIRHYRVVQWTGDRFIFLGCIDQCPEEKDAPMGIILSLWQDCADPGFYLLNYRNGESFFMGSTMNQVSVWVVSDSIENGTYKLTQQQF